MSTLTPPLPTLWTRAFCVLAIAHLLGALGYASMVLLPLYLTHLGGNRAEVGAIMASAHIAGLLTRPMVGWCLDTFGRRRSLIFGALITALSLAGVALITEVGWVAYAVRVVFGIGEGFIFTGFFALATDLIPSERRTEGFALFGVSGLLPLLVSPIADLWGVEGGGIRLFLAGVSGLIALSALLVLWVPEAAQPSTTQGPATEDVYKDVSAVVEPTSALRYLIARRLWSLWWSTIAFAGGASLLMTFASVVGAARGMEMPTAFWFTYVAGAVAARLIGAKLPEMIGPVRLVSPSLALYGSGLLTSALTQSSAGMLFAGILAGVAHGYCFPVLTSLIVSAVESRYRGRALAMFTGLWGGAAILFATLGGMIADRWSDTHMLCIAGLFLCGMSVYARPSRFSSAKLS